ncbi:MAG TPA: PKD domain-containing protein [Chitinophagaceae bacterium]
MKHFFRNISCCLVGLLCFTNAIAQNKSNKGKEFWLGYGHNVLFTQDPPVNSQTHVLYLSAEQAATVTVSVTGTSWSQTVNIPANTVDFSVIIPKSGADDARLTSEGLFNRGIHISSNVPIVAYSHQYGIFSSAATMLMPVETYGYTYYSLNYTQVSNYVDSYSWFYVVASEDNTRLEITPSDSTEGGWLPNQTYIVNLNRGQIYNVFGRRTGALSSKDMTGSKIVSVAGADGNCHPVAVFSGSSRNIICSGNGGEILQQQIFPANAWGTRYVTYHTVNNTAGNISIPFLNVYRVAVRNPTTVVRRNGVILTGLINNFYYQFQSNSGDYIEADQPVLVAQYTVSSNECAGTGSNPFGDPEMIYLSPIEQGVKRAVFYNTRNQAISLNFVNVIAPTSAISSLVIDGTPVTASEYITHPTNGSYSIAVRRLVGLAAQHSVSCDSTFIATAYGVGITESYGYNVGTFVNNLNAVTEIKNTYNTTGSIDTFTCPKSSVRLFIKTAYALTNIHWKLGNVTGMSPNTDSVIANPVPIRTELINGRTYYVYTLQQDFVFANAGTYVIPVTYASPDIDACSHTETAEINILVKPGPKADFTFPSPNCLADTIRFTGASIPGTFNLVNYTWLFDDNTTATGVNSAKLFATAGPHDIRYQVFADNGCVGDTIKTVTIWESPVAIFNQNPTTCAGDSILITDASVIAAGSITSWQWNFGDGITLVKTNNTPFYHRYTSAGNYIVSLIVVSNNGCKSDTAFMPVAVLPKPVASFSTGGNVCLGDSIRFIDASATVTGTITSWQWNFADGNTVTRTNNNPFYHTYSAAGNYPVSLVVTGSNGCSSDTFRVTVNVSSKPTATFTISGKPCIDSLQTFISSVPPGGSNPPTWQWNYGDGQSFSSATSPSISHAYTSIAANITVRHWVSFSGGCSSDTAFATISSINPNPVASFVVASDTLCVQRPVVITSAVTGVSNWYWNMGNGTSSAVPPFTHTYNSANPYTISLIVRTAQGCGSLPFTLTVNINPNPAINAGPDKFIRLGTSTTLDASISNPANYDFAWTPATFLDNPVILNPLSTPDVPTTYTIQAIDKSTHCMAADDVLVTPVSDIYIPNAFTPNNDGLNDKWNIPGLALYPEAQVAIYNRYGEAVYVTKNYYSVPWDGRHKGADQPAGVFVYLVKLNDAKNQVFKGTVALVR